MNYLMIVVTLVIILIFTFVLKRVRNPVTNLHLYYKDCTIAGDSVQIINKIFTRYHFINFYSIYIFKTNEIPKLGKSYSFYAYTIQTDGEFYIVLVSTRYKMLSILDTHPNIILGFKDGIIAVPFIPGLWGYHKFNLVINRLKNHVPIDICFDNSIVVHNNISVADDSLEILQVDFQSVHGELFKYYIIKFN